MKQEHINEVKGVIVLAMGLILLASLISFDPLDLPWYTSHPNVPANNWVRIVGAYCAGGLLFLFGRSAYFLAGLFFFWSWNKFASRAIRFTLQKFVSSLVLFCVISTLFSMAGIQEAALKFERGGLIGFVCADFLIRYLGWTGAYIILFALGTLTLILTGEFLLTSFFFKCADWLNAKVEEWIDSWEEWKAGLASHDRNAKTDIRKKIIFPKVNNFKGFSSVNAVKVVKENGEATSVKPTPPIFPVAQKQNEPNIRITAEEKKEAAIRELKPKVVGEYQLPSLDLLEDSPEISKSKLQSDLTQGARILEKTLTNFGVDVRVADIERGPVITRYELEPAPGVKVNRITALADDIALAMYVAAVRIVAPIPGKNRVGIEVPNSAKAAVYLKDVLTDARFHKASSQLTLALGKDISGQPIIADLADMPHLLIAGTTGSGKTVCVNSIIMSMLFNASPHDVKFLMVDPKMVELAPYNDIPHMLCPAVTDHKKVTAALNWVVGEMETRYNQLSKSGARNIQGYRDKGLDMPYIVIIIDELADLMQVSAKTIESAITRLAQLSRAVGIHLILATQRPSVDVITGVIKANFPARVSFKVASKVDSRTVLDMNGAETLLGKGDLLFLKPGEAKPTRGQCSYVSDQEVTNVINFIKGQQIPEYDESILQQQKSEASGSLQEKDDLYEEAVKLVIETNQASVSILQRRMRLGYTRAARLIDMMEQNGLVGPYCGSKPRDILVNREEWLLQNMKKNEDS